MQRSWRFYIFFIFFPHRFNANSDDNEQSFDDGDDHAGAATADGDDNVDDTVDDNVDATVDGNFEDFLTWTLSSSSSGLATPPCKQNIW